MESFTYTLIKSKRKTLSLEIKQDGSLIVRAPNRTTKREADAFVKKHEEWIVKKRKMVAARREQAQEVPKLTEAQLKALAQKAKEVIPARVAYYADRMGVRYGRITLRCQKTRWGSCSSKKNLNFNILLMLTPIEVIDSVVVHELCHRKHMDHSSAFYREVLRVCPDYRACAAWLRRNGPGIMDKNPA